MPPPLRVSLRSPIHIAGPTHVRLRLRSRTAVECADTSAEGRERGDIRLHSTVRQRLHANPKRKGVA